MRAPEPVDDDECSSCGGYGFFDPKTERPTIDRRGRKCLDCNGTGKKLVESAEPCSCGGEVAFVTDAMGKRIFFICPKCKKEWNATIAEIVPADKVAAWKRGVQALAAGVDRVVKADEDIGLVQLETKDGCCLELKIERVTATAPIPEGFEGPFKTVHEAAKAGGEAIEKQARKKKGEKLEILPLKKGMLVYVRAFGAERVAQVVEVGNHRGAKLRWFIPGGDRPREKWVPPGSIFRALLPHEMPNAMDVKPWRKGTFYCMDPDHRHPVEHIRDECVRKTGGRR